MKKIIKSVLAILLLAIVTMFSTLAIKESNIVAKKMCIMVDQQVNYSVIQ